MNSSPTLAVAVMAHGEEHAVAVVAGEGDRGRIEDFTKPAGPPLCETVEAVGSHRREEEEFAPARKLAVPLEFGWTVMAWSVSASARESKWSWSARWCSS